MDNGAIPVSYCSPAPYAVPAYQAPYYVIPQRAHAIPQYSAAPPYVYSPSFSSEYGLCNGAPVFKVVPSQSHQHRYPVHNVAPIDTSKKEVMLQEALENALRQQKQPKAQMVQQVPQGFVAPNARHPVYVVPEGTMLEPVHYNGYPVYRAEDVSDANRSHLPFRGFGNQQPGGVQYVNGHGIPITAQSLAVADSEYEPYGLPAAQPGMRWKLVPVADSDREEGRGAVPVARPKASSAPLMLHLKSPDSDSTAGSASDSPPVGDNVVTAQSDDDPYKQFLSLLFPKLEEEVQKKDKEDSEAARKAALGNPIANSVVPEVEVKAAAPKSVRIIPVTDAPKEGKTVVPVTDARKNEKRVILEGEGSLTEKGCSGTDAKAGPSSLKNQPGKPSTPTLKPLRLVPSLDFVKKKDSKHVAGSKQAIPQKGQGKADSHQASAENCEREKEVPTEKNVEKVSGAETPDEAGPKVEVAAKRAREKSVEGFSDVESHSVQLEKGDEPSAKKKRLITDTETAAGLIQSAYRSYMVRRCQPLKHLRDIARVKATLKEYQALAADRSSLLEKCKDAAERTKISEGIMSLLLQLDVIQGVDPVVREIRKYTSKEVLKLQSEVDAAMALISASPRKTLGSKAEDISTDGEPTARPVEQPEEQVKDLLRKLLNKLPKSGGSEGPEAVDAGEVLETDDSTLISEIVKRLSFLEEQQRNKDTDTRRLNSHEFSTDSAHGHIEKQEESTVSDMKASENSSDEVLHSTSTANEGPTRSGMADDAASDSIFEPTTSGVELNSAAGGEGSHVAPGDGGDNEENKAPIPEPMTSPTELELQSLADTVAADFVDVVLSRTEDTLGAVQSMADNKENIIKGQDILDSNDTTLHVMSEGIGSPPESTGGERQTETSLTNSAHEECSCKESIMARIEAAKEETTNSDSTKFTADAEEVQDIGLRDDAARQQFVPAEVECDSPTQAILSIQDENNVNEEAVEGKVENDSALEEASLLSSADCSKAESSASLWNGLEPPCHYSLDARSRLQLIMQDSEEVATQSAYLGEDEPCNIQQQSRITNASDQSEIPESIDVAERMNVQIPKKSFPSQEETIEADSPTSVLDAVVSMAPTDDVLSDDIAEISRDDTTSQKPSIQSARMEDPEGIKMEQSTHDSSVYEKEALQLQSAISDLQSLNNEGEFFLNDGSLQLESAISDLHSLNNSGEGFLNDLNPVENCRTSADAMVRCPSLKRITEEVYLPRPPSLSPEARMVRCPSLKRITEEVYLPRPPSLSPEARMVLEGGVSPRDVCERLCPSSASPPSSETELTLTQHLTEENTVLKELVKDVLKWGQWQSSATLSLHKMMEKLALEVLETKTTAKKAAKCKQGKNKKAAKKNNKL